jgi:RimJ/RimL family protein N-acetyltransferase
VSEELTTPRVLLRRWLPADEPEMAAINRDPDVTRLLNRPLDEAAIDGFYRLMVGHWDQHGYGPWALESLEPDHLGEFLGLAGLAMIPPYLSGAGAGPELGWRLKRTAWGRGLATESSMAARDDAFGRLGLPEIVSIIHPENARSQRVAGKLGFQLRGLIDNAVIGRKVEVWWGQAPSGGHS